MEKGRENGKKGQKNSWGREKSGAKEGRLIFGQRGRGR
jgi:hypothetical protein